MRHLKITFTTDEAKAGSILADLSGKVSSLDFEVVEQLPFYRNKPAHAPVPALDLTPSRKGTTGKNSVIPGMFAKALVGKQLVTVQQIKAVLATNKMSPGSYTHAINTLKVAGLIKATNDRGTYEVLK
jgi:hypothetical protein